MTTKTYTETNAVPYYDECDVLVVGSGCAGHSAAIAAARAGCKNIILMERYGYSGGDVTGAYVLMVPKLSWYNQTYVRGIQQEWFDRLKVIPGAVLGPEPEEVGSSDPVLVNLWGSYMGGVTRPNTTGVANNRNNANSINDMDKRVVNAGCYDADELKIEMDAMLLEHKDAIRVLYHCWGTKPIMEDNEIKGVIFESKEGRRAISAKVVIDATGDGDIFRQAGAPFAGLADTRMRSSATSLGWRVGGVNHEAFYEWKKANPQVFEAMRAMITKRTGFMTGLNPESRDGVYWASNFHRNRDCANIKDMTYTEIITRSTIREILDIYKKYCPIGFKDAYLYDIAPQLGCRCSYRLVGEYVMSPKDWAFAAKHDDVIAWHSTVSSVNDGAPVEIPYRAILPQKVDGMLCPGRHISTDDVAIDWVNLIPQCIGTGQAAGIAAAVAVADGTTVRSVDIKKVQDILVRQGVPLPRRGDVDPALTQNCEEHEYGMYTEVSKKMREEMSLDKDFIANFQ